jgi:hypothetical protein
MAEARKPCKLMRSAAKEWGQPLGPRLGQHSDGGWLQAPRMLHGAKLSLYLGTISVTFLLLCYTTQLLSVRLLPL